MKRRAFAVGAHPDDIEFVMAGTLILLGEAGYELHVMHVASGSGGSAVLSAEETARVRGLEAETAAGLIGAVYHGPLVNDLDIFYEKPLLARVAAVLRDVAPEILLLPSPQDYMEDHMIAGRLGVTAAFCRGLPNFRTDPPRPPVEQDVTVYHAQPHGNRDPVGGAVRPGHFVDIGEALERKKEMLGCHQSQKRWLDETQGMDSYIHTMVDFSREVGAMSGAFEYAEGWRRRLHYGFCAADADPIAAALGARCRPAGEHAP